MQAIYVYAGKLSENEVSPQDAAAGFFEAMVLACIGCGNLPLTVSMSTTSSLQHTVPVVSWFSPSGGTVTLLLAVNPGLKLTVLLTAAN